jgi:hypothetical protein
LDRRYKEAQGASKAGMQKSEAITRNTTRRARVQAHGAKQYGGSTGGRKSLAGGNQQVIMQSHNEEALERSKTFKEQSMGSQFKNDWKSQANVMNAGQRGKFKQGDMSS